MMEGRGEEVAYTGTITRARRVGRDVVITYALDVDAPVFLNSALFAIHDELGMDEWEFRRGHWAVKDVDLYRTLFPIGTPRRRLPTAFRLNPHEAIDKTLVSAMMPFDPAFTAVYESILRAAHSAGLRAQRADDIWEAAEIIQDIVTLIDRSLVVVCDCTGRNPNVFYETGIAHALGRDVILITQVADDVPFDLRHHRYIRYLDNAEGRAALTTALQGRIETLAGL